MNQIQKQALNKLNQKIDDTKGEIEIDKIAAQIQSDFGLSQEEMNTVLVNSKYPFNE